MEEEYLTIKKVVLNNNCPECFNMGDLFLTFKQKVVENKFYKSITSEIKHGIACKTCNTNIYPVQWTDDIERVVDYQKRAFTPKPSSTYLKKASWIVIIVVILLIITSILILTLPIL